MLIEIHFRNKEDAEALCFFLQQQIPDKSIGEYTLHFEGSHIVRGRNKDNREEELLQWTKRGLCLFLLKMKVNEWLKQILSSSYFYRDEAEQQQIMDIIYSVLDGKNTELNAFLPKMNLEERLFALVHDWFREQTVFSFDHFMKFRLRSLIHELEKYVELSLDEYKMEQEYQVFIQKLREFLYERPPKMKKLHLLFDEGVTFYNEHFIEMKREELVNMIDRRLLINHPVYVDSVTIAPLLSIAPSSIYLYTADAEQPLVRTIQNIFEERVICHHIAAFHEMKNGFCPLSMKEDMSS